MTTATFYYYGEEPIEVVFPLAAPIRLGWQNLAMKCVICVELNIDDEKSELTKWVENVIKPGVAIDGKIVFEKHPLAKPKETIDMPDSNMKQNNVAVNQIMQFFDYEHLPEQLKVVSARIGDVAHYMYQSLPDGPEKEAGLRKLLEAKDCFVRANFIEVKEREAKEGG